MHVTHPLWLAELCPRKWWGRRVLPSLPLACQTSALLMSYVPKNLERVNGVAPSSQPWHGRILLLKHTRIRVRIADLRFQETQCAPSPQTRPPPRESEIGIRKSEMGETPGRSLPPARIPRTGPLELLRVQGSEMVRTSGNAPDPGTHLVRSRL